MVAVLISTNEEVLKEMMFDILSDGLQSNVKMNQKIVEAASTIPLIDHHVHGTFSNPITRETFEESINEASIDPIPQFMSQFDSQLGFAIRRWCSPMLGLDMHAPADEYWSTRTTFSSQELDRRMLTHARVGHWVMDTGFSSQAITTPMELGERAGGLTSEIVRLESIAEALMASEVPVKDFVNAFRSEVEHAAKTAVGFKTIVAYRTGFKIDWTIPFDTEVTIAVSKWANSRQSIPRLADPTIEAFIIHTALSTGLPLQIHVGFGDRDLDLHHTNPMDLLPLLRQPHVRGTSIALLHCYPFHREAGYLAQAFENVYFDIGLAINYLGAQSSQLIRESLELSPFAKQMYSSDAFGLPELHVLGSILWRRGMAAALSDWVISGEWSESDACRVLKMIGSDNAKRVYKL